MEALIYSTWRNWQPQLENTDPNSIYDYRVQTIRTIFTCSCSHYYTLLPWPILIVWILSFQLFPNPFYQKKKKKFSSQIHNLFYLWFSICFGQTQQIKAIIWRENKRKEKKKSPNSELQSFQSINQKVSRKFHPSNQGSTRTPLLTN